MDRGKMPSTGRGAKSKAPQHPQDIFALGTKSTVVVSRDAEKRNIHKPSTSAADRKRDASSYGSQPPSKRSRIGSPAETTGGTSLEVDPVDLVPNVLQALDTHNSDKLLGLLTGSIRLLKSQRSKPDPILAMSLLYLTKIRPNMFAHDTVTQSLCTLLKREQGAAFKNKGNPLVFVLACNMLYAGHRDSTNWPDIFIKVYIEDALNERWWVECSWCKCLVENILTAFGTKHPPASLKPTESTLGSGSPLMGSTEDDVDNTELEYTVFPRYSSSYEAVEGLVMEAIKDQIQRRSAAPDAIGKGFLKLLSATCGFPEIRMVAASRLEAWLHSGKLWKVAQELLAYVCCNCEPTAPRDHEVLAQLVRMRLKTKQLQLAYQACLREMVSESPALLRSVVTHTVYNELSNVRSPNNLAVLAALVHAQPQLAPAALADTFQELLVRSEDYLRPLRALTRECVRAARADSHALLPLARALAAPPPHDPPAEVRERAFASLADLFCCCCLVTASHSKHQPEYRQQLCGIQAAALGWLQDTAVPVYRPSRHDCQLALNKIMFVESADAYSKADNWPPEPERGALHRLCCEAPLPQTTLLRLIFIGLAKEVPVAPAEVFELVEQLVRRACALPPEDNPLQVDKLEIADLIFQLCQFNPPDNITLPQGYSPPPLAITSLYWRGWLLLTMIAAHNPQQFAERAATTYPTLRALIEMCITNKPSIEWGSGTGVDAERAEAERAAILQLETHLAAASNAKLPVTEHNSRLLSQLTTLEPLGAPRKPPQAIIESLQALNAQLRLGKLLCRQPALLLELVERHGTRRAMPWLLQLLRHDQLELSVLPVQCLCEFLSSGGGAGEAGEAGGAEGRAGELCAHVRRTLAASPAGARAVLLYYVQRLAHAHKHTRARASRGLKLVLSQSSEDTNEMDFSAEVNPEEWLELLWELRHWESVREEVVARIRAACLVECIPRHVAAYIDFLASYAAKTPHKLHTEIVLDLCQVLMERSTVMNSVLGGASGPSHPEQHRTLLALTSLFYDHLQKVRNNTFPEEEEGEGGWPGGDRISLQFSPGRRTDLPLVIAHAHLKLLCYGPSANIQRHDSAMRVFDSVAVDTEQAMYSGLAGAWLEAVAGAGGAGAAGGLLPDWLRLHLVRSARPALLDAGLRSLPAHKLALFIQTFGMPVSAMSALLGALDACPAGAVVRLGVERAYMTQLLRVQRARGACGGAAFAAALRLQPPHYPPDFNLFASEPLPEEAEGEWGSAAPPPRLQLELVPTLLAAVFSGTVVFPGDVDTSFTKLIAEVTNETSNNKYSRVPKLYSSCVTSFLLQCCSATGVLSLARRPDLAAPLLRALRPGPHLASSLLSHCKCLSGPVVTILRGLVRADPAVLPDLPPRADREHLVALLESATPSTLEAIGNKIIESQDTAVVVDVISLILERNQEGYYENKVKPEDGIECDAPLFSNSGRGCGLLLDWLSELQQETLGPDPHKQMQLMFRAGGGAAGGSVGGSWRPLLVTLLAHRASWRTLHTCLTMLLDHPGDWAPGSVLNLLETLCSSPRLCQGRDKAAPKHHQPPDALRLTHRQVGVLVGYIVSEGVRAERGGGEAALRRRVEARLPLLLRCCATPPALLAAARAAAHHHPVLLLMLYLKVPKTAELLRRAESRGGRGPGGGLGGGAGAGAARCTPSATDQPTHTLLTAITAPHHAHTKEHTQKLWRMEADIRSMWARVEGAGARALPLAGALLRGAGALHAKQHQYLLSALEVLPDSEIFAPAVSEEIHSILECFVQMVRQTEGGSSALSHRVAALLRRYLACRPPRAALLLHQHRDAIASSPALSGVSEGEGGSGSWSPPPHAVRALQRRSDPPDTLHWLVQEVEAWGARRGGGWGGAESAGGVLRAVAPLAAHAHAPLRLAALSLLARLLPAAPDPAPAFEAIMECLECDQAEIAQSALEKLPELVVGMQEYAAALLAAVFDLGVRGRLNVETHLAKTIQTLNLHRAC
ncbi:integrator complex subunit 1 isoform X3 [Bombyx mori]|uniref:Integrator complex subunit 1 n=1 Tax=Bombyx mori TaxID=7091 RepID=A0A8R2M712_BOMMO|nr:integrator complex subunit 1 isoform X3 [Bombyx mori]